MGGQSISSGHTATGVVVTTVVVTTVMSGGLSVRGYSDAVHKI